MDETIALRPTNWKVMHMNPDPLSIRKVGTGGSQLSNVYAFPGSRIVIDTEDGRQIEGIPSIYDHYDSYRQVKVPRAAILDNYNKRVYMIDDDEISRNIIQQMTSDYASGGQGVYGPQASASIQGDSGSVVVPYRYTHALPEGKTWESLTEEDINKLTEETALRFIEDTRKMAAGKPPELRQIIAQDFPAQLEHVRSMASAYYRTQKLTAIIRSPNATQQQKQEAQQMLNDLMEQMKVSPNAVDTLNLTSGVTGGTVDPDKFFLQQSARWDYGTMSVIPQQPKGFVGTPQATAEYLAEAGRGGEESKSGIRGTALPFVMATINRPTNIPVALPKVVGPSTQASATVSRMRPTGGGGGGSRITQPITTSTLTFDHTRDTGYTFAYNVDEATLANLDVNPAGAYGAITSTQTAPDKSPIMNNFAAKDGKPGEASLFTSKGTIATLGELKDPTYYNVLNSMTSNFITRQDLASNILQYATTMGDSTVLFEAVRYLTQVAQNTAGGSIDQNLAREISKISSKEEYQQFIKDRLSGGQSKGFIDGLHKIITTALEKTGVVTKDTSTGQYRLNWDGVVAGSKEGNEPVSGAKASAPRRLARSVLTAFLDITSQAPGRSIIPYIPHTDDARMTQVGREALNAHISNPARGQKINPARIGAGSPGGEFVKATDNHMINLAKAIAVGGSIMRLRDFLNQYGYGAYRRSQ